MPKSYLEKYYKDNNPVTNRLEINNKILFRMIGYILCTVIFFVLLIANHNNIFSDISNGLLILIYVVMSICAVIGMLGIVSLALYFISKQRFEKLFQTSTYERKRIIFTFLDWFLVIPICVCIALFTYGYLFRIQMVSGPSMEPSFYNKERIVSIYDQKNIQRGDVVICRVDQELFPDHEDIHIIKRVVGKAGDQIKWDNGILYINGDDVYEDYTSKSSGTSFNGEFFIYNENGNKEYIGATIPEGYVFVLGDNRGNSQDSRKFGLIPLDHVLGVVTLKFDGLKPSKVERGVLE